MSDELPPIPPAWDMYEDYMSAQTIKALLARLRVAVEALKTIEQGSSDYSSLARMTLQEVGPLPGEWT